MYHTYYYVPVYSRLENLQLLNYFTLVTKILCQWSPSRKLKGKIILLHPSKSPLPKSHSPKVVKFLFCDQTLQL